MTTFYLNPQWTPPNDEVVLELYKPSELFAMTRRYSPTHTITPPQIINNSVTFSIDGTTFESSSVDITANRDSFCWSLSANIIGSDDMTTFLALSSKIATVVINGYTFTFIIERWALNTAFGRNAYNINGRSQTASMARPNTAGRTRTEQNLKLVSEIIDDELSLYSGYTATMELPDWYIYGKVFSYQNLSTIQVIKRFADAVGGSIYSDPTNKTLTLTPYYRVRPIEFDVTDPELILDADGIINSSTSYNLGTDISACRVIGEKAGVATSILPLGNDETETWWGGFSGQTDVTVDDITWQAGGYERNVADNLITSEVPAVLRGAYELDREFNFYRTNFTTFLESSTCKLVTPNLFVQIVNSANCGYKGLVDSVAISASVDSEGLRVTQSFMLESLEMVVL